MITNNKIRDEKLQYDINREGAQISALSTGKIDKYEYLTGGEILSSNRRLFSFRKRLRKTNKKTGWCFKVSRHF